MALQFQGAPDWLLKEYMSRKDPTQVAAEGIQGVLGTYMTLDNQRQLLAAKQQESRRQQEELDMKKRGQFYDTGDTSLLSPTEQQAISNPAQGPANYMPPEQVPYEMQQQGVLGGAQGPVQPTGALVPPRKSPAIERMEAFLAKFPQGYKGKGEQGEHYFSIEDAKKRGGALPPGGKLYPQTGRNIVLSRDQFGKPILVDKDMKEQIDIQGLGGGAIGNTAQDAVLSLRQTAPKLADRLIDLVDEAHPKSNPLMRTSVEGASAASQVSAILKDPNPSQVGLQSLGFYLARMAGSNSQLSDAERMTFEKPLALVDRVVNKGYKLVKGDLSPMMRKDLLHLADTLGRKTKIQGQRIIDAQKRRARSELGRFYTPGLDSSFPSMEELSVSDEDMIPKTQQQGRKKSFIEPGEEAEYEAYKRSLGGQ